MTMSRTTSVALVGTRGHLVTIDASVVAGRPATTLSGLPTTGLREIKDRVRAAVRNTQVAWPPVRGVLPRLLAARDAGLASAIVPAESLAEAAMVDGIAVRGARHLSDVLAWLREDHQLERPPRHAVTEDGPGVPDVADVVGQPEAKRALEIAAAGGHHIFLIGPPGTGKTALARRLPGILPALTSEEACEVAAIYSADGSFSPRATAPPIGGHTTDITPTPTYPAPTSAPHSGLPMTRPRSSTEP